jgi:hypothetical protein
MALITYHEKAILWHKSSILVLGIVACKCLVNQLYSVDGVFWYTKHVHYTLVWI